MSSNLTFKDVAVKLSEPFLLSDLAWKPQRTGIGKNGPWAMVAPYIDARAIMDRLDTVMGPANWQTKFIPAGKGFLCELSLNVGGVLENQWVTKVDGSEETDIEGFKGGISKALVRAAVQWGIGRYLYALPTLWADFAEVDEKTEGSIQIKIDGSFFYWVPPNNKIPMESLAPEDQKERRDSRGQKEPPPNPPAKPAGIAANQQAYAAAKPSALPNCTCGNRMMVSKMNTNELYCVKCKRKAPR